MSCFLLAGHTGLELLMSPSARLLAQDHSLISWLAMSLSNGGEGRCYSFFKSSKSWAISASFFALVHPFNCFSRRMAVFKSE